MTLKIILVCLIVICVIIAVTVGLFVPEVKYKNNTMQRIKIIARVRVGCFLAMLIFAFICIII